MVNVIYFICNNYDNFKFFINSYTNITSSKFIRFTVGQRLCRLDSSYTLGKGTYKRQDYIYSSLAGIVNVDDTNKVIKYLIY